MMSLAVPASSTRDQYFALERASEIKHEFLNGQILAMIGLARRLLFLPLLIALLGVPLAAAQEGLDLPADLYVLYNDGRVERFGVGTSGVATVTPSDAFVLDFGIDPSGTRLAYRTESGLFLLDLSLPGSSALPVEGGSADVPPFRGVGDTIVWSSSGDAIAYTTTYGARVYFSAAGAPVFIDLREAVFRQISWSPGGRFLAAESESEGVRVWWIYRREGAALLLTSIITDGMGVAWISDSDIVFAPNAGGLRLMSLDRANQQISLLDDSTIYRLPALDATDALVFFARDPADAGVPDGYGILLRLERGAQSVQVVGATPVALGGLTWSPDGRMLVAFQGGVMAFFNPADGLGFPLPINSAVAYDWGPVVGVTAPVAPTQPAPATDLPTVVEPTLAPPTAEPLPTREPTPIPIVTTSALVLAADGYFLAPGTNGVVQVWRLPADGSPPAPFTRNTSDAVEFAASPVAQAVAYVVDAELWLQIANQEPFRLARLNTFAPVTPVFSPEGLQVAYADEGTGIWRIAVEAAREGEDPELLRARIVSDAGIEQAMRRPQFSPDGSKLLFDLYAGESGTIANNVLDIASRQMALGVPLPADDPRPGRARWLRDGRIYSLLDAAAAVDSPPGVYLIDPPQPSGGALIASLPAGAVVRAVNEPLSGMLRLVIAPTTAPDAPLGVFDLVLTEGTLTPVIEIGALTAPRLSPEGRFIGGFESLTPEGGTLTVIDLLTGRRFLLSSAAGARQFTWSGAGG
ncbi:MAG: hypothetical protein L6Q98_19315 [Anaerolineae bacterium]|nr:hypothetical protein [Anaerolineae bacterium]NUQ07093.1 hypothetical protein [Anaerolineae bacterium]